MHKSTHKPKRNKLSPIDIPENSINTIKRVVRIVQQPSRDGKLVSIGTQTQTTQKKSVSVGIQVGESAFAFHTSSNQYIEPPLRSYWTHKVNLPYPQFANLPIALQQQQQQYIHTNIAQPPYTLPQVNPYQHMYPTYQPPTYQPPTYVQPPVSNNFQANIQPPVHFNRKNRRNYVKKQKYMQRKEEKQN